MIYHVRLQYGIYVDATDKTQAYRMACKALRENPGSHIASIKQPDAPRGDRSLLWRLLRGR